MHNLPPPPRDSDATLTPVDGCARRYQLARAEAITGYATGWANTSSLTCYTPKVSPLYRTSPHKLLPSTCRYFSLTPTQVGARAAVNEPGSFAEDTTGCATGLAITLTGVAVKHFSSPSSLTAERATFTERVHTKLRPRVPDTTLAAVNEWMRHGRLVVAGEFCRGHYMYYWPCYWPR